MLVWKRKSNAITYINRIIIISSKESGMCFLSVSVSCCDSFSSWDFENATSINFLRWYGELFRPITATLNSKDLSFTQKAVLCLCSSLIGIIKNADEISTLMHIFPLRVYSRVSRLTNCTYSILQLKYGARHDKYLS